MSVENLPVRPSDDSEILTRQLVRELERLADDGDDTEPQAYRAYLGYALSGVWRRVARGDILAPQQLLERLKRVRSFIDRHLPTLSAAPAAAAELLAALHSLDLATESLAEIGVEERLADRQRSATERKILHILAESGDFLRRGEVHERMRREVRPSSARVSQILSDLYEENLLLRYQRPARGGRSVPFYALAPRGRELCGRLKLDREPWQLYDGSEALQNEYLDAKYLWPEEALDEPGRVTVFWAFRGGLGRSTAIAHVARILAGQLARDEQVLVLDLDLDAPDLDAFFASCDPGASRGLRGLIVDYHQHEESARRDWLRQSLTDESYVLRPFPKLPNLRYLPSGFTPAGDPTVEAERAEAVASLWAQAGNRGVEGTAAAVPRGGFLQDLADALPQLFRKTLVDSSAGLGPSSWLATMVLADELVLFARHLDEELNGMRVQLSNFLRRRYEDLDESRSRVAVVRGFHPSQEDLPTPDFWQSILINPGRDDVFPFYDLPFDVALTRRTDRDGGSPVRDREAQGVYKKKLEKLADGLLGKKFSVARPKLNHALIADLNHALIAESNATDDHRRLWPNIAEGLFTTREPSIGISYLSKIENAPNDVILGALNSIRITMRLNREGVSM